MRGETCLSPVPSKLSTPSPFCKLETGGCRKCWTSGCSMPRWTPAKGGTFPAQSYRCRGWPGRGGYLLGTRWWTQGAPNRGWPPLSRTIPRRNGLIPQLPRTCNVWERHCRFTRRRRRGFDCGKGCQDIGFKLGRRIRGRPSASPKKVHRGHGTGRGRAWARLSHLRLWFCRIQKDQGKGRRDAAEGCRISFLKYWV